jgi:hypothetical protein
VAVDLLWETIGEEIERQTEINITSMKVYNGQEDKKSASQNELQTNWY